MTRKFRLQFILTYTTTVEQTLKAVVAVSDAAHDGALSAGAVSGLPITRFPLAETAPAHRAVEPSSGRSWSTSAQAKVDR